MSKIRTDEDETICAKCQGKCCKRIGCHLSPDDVFHGEEGTIEKIRELLNTGNYSIDWSDVHPVSEWLADEDFKAYFLRVRNRRGNIVDPSYGGICSLLTENGCKLDFEHRPTGGKALIPCEEEMCYTTYSKQQACIDWLPYHDMFELLEVEYSSVEPPDDGPMTPEEIDYLKKMERLIQLIS